MYYLYKRCPQLRYNKINISVSKINHELVIKGLVHIHISSNSQSSTATKTSSVTGKCQKIRWNK